MSDAGGNPSTTQQQGSIDMILEAISGELNRLLTAFMLVITGGQIVLALNYTAEGRLFPLVVGIPLFVMLLVILGAQSSKRFQSYITEFKPATLFETDEVDNMADTEASEAASREVRKRVLSVIMWILSLLTLIYITGFLWAIIIFTLAFYRFEAGQSWGRSTLFTLIVWVIIVLIFVWALNLRFYQGILGLPHPLPPFVI